LPSSNAGSSVASAAAIAAESSSLIGTGSSGSSSVGARGLSGSTATAPTVSTIVETVASAGFVDLSVGDATFAYVAMPEGQSVTYHSGTTLASSTASTSSFNANLLLLDLAWEDSDEASYDDAHDSLLDEGHEDVHVGDLALAAFFNESDDWNSI
jgi:hypothetical protein